MSNTFGRSERIGNPTKAKLTAFFDQLCLAVVRNQVTLPDDWIQKSWLVSIIREYDIRWLLDNIIMWSGNEWLHPLLSGFKQIKLSDEAKHMMSRDNHALVVRMIKGHESAEGYASHLISCKAKAHLEKMADVVGYDLTQVCSEDELEALALLLDA